MEDDNIFGGMYDGGFDFGGFAQKWVGGHASYALIAIVVLIVIVIILLFMHFGASKAPEKSTFMPSHLMKLQTAPLSGTEALEMPTAAECAAHKPVGDDAHAWMAQNISEVSLPANPTSESFTPAKSEGRLSMVLAGY